MKWYNENGLMVPCGDGPQTHVRWMNVYPCMEYGTLHMTEKEADQAATGIRIACIRIEYEDGEGL